jgi:hypothetical protein
MANAISERQGQSQPLQAARTQAATYSILAFTPLDAVEAMIAGHCVMFHEAIVDTLRIAMRGEEGAKRRGSLGIILAMDKAFGNNLTRLERYRKRRDDSQPAVIDLAETDIADRVRRHESQTPPREPARTEPSGQKAGSTMSPPNWPSPEQIAACRDNPEAMAALDAADPARFARAQGVEHPSEAYVAAASAQMAGFNRTGAEVHSSGAPAHRPGGTEGAYAGNRQARRHPNR